MVEGERAATISRGRGELERFVDERRRCDERGRDECEKAFALRRRLVYMLVYDATYQV